MWVISLPSKGLTKAVAAMSLLAVLLSAALGWMAWRCAREGYGRLLLAISDSPRGISPQAAEEFCRENFLVTYAIETQSTAEAHNFRLPVTLVGTNSYFAQILSYRLLSGGFFSAAAWKAENREAVLNAAAAFQLYGSYDVVGQSLRMDNTVWLVAGVLDDGDADKPRVYAPASVTGGNADSLMVLLDDHLVNVDYAKNGLKELGVYEGNATVVHLAAAAAAFGQRLTVGLRGMLILLILLLLRRCGSFALRRLPHYREQMKQRYLREVLAANRKDLLKTALALAALLVGVVALGALALQILAICLGWPGQLPAGHDWAMGGFAGKLAWLHDWRPIGVATFAALVVVLGIIGALALCEA